jgi:hypothetical protein
LGGGITHRLLIENLSDLLAMLARGDPLPEKLRRPVCNYLELSLNATAGRVEEAPKRRMELSARISKAIRSAAGEREGHGPILPLNQREAVLVRIIRARLASCDARGELWSEYKLRKIPGNARVRKELRMMKEGVTES